MKQCDCADWELSMRQITGAQGLAYVHGINYTGKPFSYCPWCGKELEEVHVEEMRKEGKRA